MDQSDPTGDGGGIDLDDRQQYEIIRTAIEDALLNVIGTIVLLVFAFGFLVVGAFLVVDGETVPALAIGGTMMVAACLGAAFVLDLLPSHERLR